MLFKRNHVWEHEKQKKVVSNEKDKFVTLYMYKRERKSGKEAGKKTTFEDTKKHKKKWF